MFFEFSISIRSPLVCFNILVLYSALKKTRKSALNILTGSFCILGIFHYVTTVAIFSFLNDVTSRALVNWVDYMVFIMYCEMMVLFFIDRYFATVFPLLYKVGMKVKYAYVSVAITSLITGSSFIIVMTLVYCHVLDYNRYILARIVQVLILITTITLLFCTFAICKALLHFFGRQMYIFRRTFCRLRRENLPCLSKTIIEDVFENKQTQSCSKDVQASEISITIPEKVDTKRVQKLSVPSYMSNEKKLTLRQTRHSCPHIRPSPDEVHSLLVESLAKEVETEQAKQIQLPRRNRSSTFSTFEYEASKVNEKRTNRSNSAQCFSLAHHSYTLINFISDLRYLRINHKSEKSATFSSESKHLVLILIAKLIIHVFAWLPFVIFSLLMGTKGDSVKIDEKFVDAALHVAVCCHHMLPIVYAMACQPYRQLMRQFFNGRTFNRRSRKRCTIRRRVRFSSIELDKL